MRNKIILIVLAIAGFIGTSSAQSEIDDLLNSIAQNNKEINSHKQLMDAKNLEYKTAQNLSNPTFEYNRLNEKSGTGTNTEFGVTQEFDFPTAYIHKSKIYKQQVTKSSSEYQLVVQDILLNAKLTSIEVIYLNKRHTEISKRLEDAETLNKNYKLKLDKGAANILDYNKSKLQLMALQNEMRSINSELQQLNDHLTELNGGTNVKILSTEYAEENIAADFEGFFAEYKANDPDLKIAEVDKEIYSKNISLTRSMALPKLSAGYRNESDGVSEFSGVHMGISIPIFEGRKTVKQAKSMAIFSEMEQASTINIKYYKTKQIFGEYLSLKENINEYSSTLETINNVELLEKAFKLGQISSIEYFMELSYFYDVYDSFLELEKDYHKIIATLNKFKLIN